VTKTSYIYVTYVNPTVTIPVTVNTTNYNLRSAAITAGWNQVDPLNVTLAVSSGVVISSNSTGMPALVIDGAYPAGSVINVNNAGYIIGMGGKGGDGNTSTLVGKSYVIATPYTSGLPGGPALQVAPTVPANLTVNINNTGGVIGGGGGGGGGAYSVVQPTSPGGGGGRTGSTNSAGGGGGYGSYPGTFGGAGPGLVPGGHGNSGDGGNWGSGGAQGYAWPGDYVVTNGGAGGNATIGNAYITWIAVGTRYGTLG
jgi:hypothetical protein